MRTLREWTFKIEERDDGSFSVESRTRARLRPTILCADFPKIQKLTDTLRVRGRTRKGPDNSGRYDEVLEPEVEIAERAWRQEHVKAVGEKILLAILGSEEAGHVKVFRSQVADALAGDEFVSLTIDLSEAPSLQPVPFEMLFWREDNHFLAASRNFGLRRFFDRRGVSFRPEDIVPPVRILIVVSNPHTDPDMLLDTGKELEGLQRAIKDAEQATQVPIVSQLLQTGADDPKDLPTLRNLQARVKSFGPHIIHYIGHGFFDEVGYLELQKEGAKPAVDEVDADSIVTVLEDRRPWLVVLNSCEGAVVRRDSNFGGMSQSILDRGIPFVVAMSRPITDEAAKSFSEEFYPTLLGGATLSEAMSSARKQIKLHIDRVDDPELFTPVYYTCIPEDSLQIALPPPAAKQAASPPPTTPSAVQPSGKKAGLIVVAALGGLTVLALFGMLSFGSGPVELVRPDPDIPVGQRPPSDPGDVEVENGSGATGSAGGGSGASAGSGNVQGGNDGPVWTVDRRPAGSSGGVPINCDDETARRDPQCLETTAARVPPDPRGNLNTALRGPGEPLPPPPPPPRPTPPPAPPAPPPPLPCYEQFQIFFERGETEIVPDYDIVLAQAARELGRCSGTALLVEGHDDREGSDSVSLARSRARTQASVSALVSSGVPQGLITVESFGETLLWVQTPDGVADPLNRRVVIRVVPVASGSPAAELRSAWDEYRTAVQTLRGKLAQIEVLRTTEAGRDLLQNSSASENAERQTIVAQAGGLADEETQRRHENAPEFRAASEQLRRQAAQLDPVIDEYRSRATAKQTHAAAIDRLEEALDGLDAVRSDIVGNEVHPLFEREDYADDAALIEQANALVRSETARRSGTREAFIAARTEILETVAAIDALAMRYINAGEWRKRKLADELQSLVDALHDDDRLYLEIISPYSRDGDRQRALCSGLQLRDQILGRVREDIYDLDPQILRIDTAEACDEPVPQLAPEDEDRAVFAEFEFAPITPQRIVVRTSHREFGRPVYGDIPLGARTEIRLRLRGSETLAFDPHSGGATEELRREVAALTDWYRETPPGTAPSQEEIGLIPFEPAAKTYDFILVIEDFSIDSSSLQAEARLVNERVITTLGLFADMMDSMPAIEAYLCARPWQPVDGGSPVEARALDNLEVSLRPFDVKFFTDECLSLARLER